MYEGQSGAPWWIRLDAVTTERYLVAIQSGYIDTALPAAIIGPRLRGYGGALPAPRFEETGLLAGSGYPCINQKAAVKTPLLLRPLHATHAAGGHAGTETLISSAVRAQLLAWLAQDGAVLGSATPAQGGAPAGGPAVGFAGVPIVPASMGGPTGSPGGAPAGSASGAGSVPSPVGAPGTAQARGYLGAAVGTAGVTFLPSLAVGGGAASLP